MIAYNLNCNDNDEYFSRKDEYQGKYCKINRKWEKEQLKFEKIRFYNADKMPGIFSPNNDQIPSFQICNKNVQKLTLN